MKVKCIEHKCMNCCACFTVEDSMCRDGMTCPACKGKLLAIGVETTNKYADGQPLLEPTLLMIILDNETSVPKVFYKGEEITKKVNVYFDWDTDTEYMGGLSYAIEHYEKGSYPVANRIERRVKGHCVD